MLTDKKMRQTAFYFTFAMIIFIAGCSGGAEKGPERYHVSGSVTFKGKPVPFGSIMFFPDSKKGNKGPMGVAEIVDGKFDTAKNGRGIVGGAHLITITGVSEKSDPQVDNPLGKSLFKPYKTEFDFPKETTTHDFVVKGVSKNHLLRG